MVNPVFFDVWEDNEAYKLCAIGDDGYLYWAEVDHPNITATNEKISFNKVDIVKIELVIDKIKFGRMKIISKPAQGPLNQATYEVYVVIQALSEVGKTQAKLYRFYKEYSAVINTYQWRFECIAIPNATLCMEYFNDSLILGGVDGIVVVDTNDLQKAPFLVDKIGRVLTLRAFAYFTFAGTERGLLVSMDGFRSLGFHSYYPETTNQNLLAGGVGKIIALAEIGVNEGTSLFLFGDNGISRALFKYEEAKDKKGSNYEFKMIWGMPIPSKAINTYQYSTAINHKDLAEGMFLPPGEYPVKLFILDNYQIQGVLLEYKTSFDFKTQTIIRDIVADDPYFNIKPFNIQVNPIIKLAPRFRRMFALSNQMELSVLTITHGGIGGEMAWTKIMLAT